MTEQEMNDHAEYYANLRMNVEDSYIHNNKDIIATALELKMQVDVLCIILEAERIL
jgi:hypothetical protein